MKIMPYVNDEYIEYERKMRENTCHKNDKKRIGAYIHTYILFHIIPFIAEVI